MSGTPSQVSDIEIVDEPASQRYVLKSQPSDAHISYVIRRDDVIAYDLVHTFVSPDLRGGGLASRLAKFAIEHARQDGHKIIPTCSYIATYMQRHPEDNDVLL